MRGFTLLEVLVATAVLAVAMVSLLGLHARNLALVADTQELTEAGLLASRLATAASSGPAPPLGSTRGKLKASATSATYSWKRDVDSTAVPGLTQVRIEVRREDGHPNDDLLADLVFLLPGGSR